jgi:hypothetical protein
MQPKVSLAIPPDQCNFGEPFIYNQVFIKGDPIYIEYSEAVNFLFRNCMLRSNSFL